MISKEIVTRVVDSCYSSPYKVFTINSYDGYRVTKPLGLFISLGVTTSMKTMSIVLNELRSQLRCNVVLGEIASKYIDGRYINNVVAQGDEVTQYSSDSITEGLRLTVDELRDFIFDTKSKIVKNVDDDNMVIELTNRLTKMLKVLNKMESNPSLYQQANLIDDKGLFDIYVINNNVNYVQHQEELNGATMTIHKRIGILINF